MSFLISLFFIVGCLSFENQFSIDRDGDGFYPWIVPSQTDSPYESTLLYDETTGHFSYSIGFEDYLYSPCE